jgi:hypothetical protein
MATRAEAATTAAAATRLVLYAAANLVILFAPLAWMHRCRIFLRV